jgi:hypothetical protein
MVVGGGWWVGSSVPAKPDQIDQGQQGDRQQQGTDGGHRNPACDRGRTLAGAGSGAAGALVPLP